MFLLAIILTLLALLAWLLAELNAKVALRIAAGSMLFACVAYAGLLGGKLKADLDASWVPKEHMLLAGGMEKLEHLAEAGDTNALLRALSAYNQKVRPRTNDFGFYEAAMDLHLNTGESK